MDERIAANRDNWNDRTAIHLDSEFYDVEAWLRDGTGPRAREIAVLGDVTGLRLVHLQCHFGLDTMQWARAGARVTGLDFSSAAIEAARDIAQRAGLADRAEFVCANVYDALDVLEPASFDVVYISLGAICWLPSIDKWGEQVAGLLAPGGRVYLHEGHPMGWALADDSMTVEFAYFEVDDEPYVDDDGTTYTDGDGTIEHTRNYGWNHSISETCGALMRRGLRLDWFEEHDWTVWARFPWLVQNTDGNWTNPPGMPRIPLTFSLLASKPPA